MTNYHTINNRKKKTSSEVAKIQGVLGKTKTKDKISLDQFSVDEKCTAINNFMDHADIDFNRDFVNSVYSYYQNRGTVTNNQLAAIDNIINKYKIDVPTWCY